MDSWQQVLVELREQGRMNNTALSGTEMFQPTEELTWEGDLALMTRRESGVSCIDTIEHGSVLFYW